MLAYRFVVLVDSGGSSFDLEFEENVLLGRLMAGGVIRAISAPTPEAYLAGISRAVKYCVPAPTAMIVNYPSNPTAMVASLDFYRDLVLFAKKHEIFVLSDLAYAEVYFDGDPPPSVLQAPGAFEVAVEFSSMSKTYSMAGWRIGFAVGNERIIAALARSSSTTFLLASTTAMPVAKVTREPPVTCV